MEKCPFYSWLFHKKNRHLWKKPFYNGLLSIAKILPLWKSRYITRDPLYRSPLDRVCIVFRAERFLCTIQNTGIKESVKCSRDCFPLWRTDGRVHHKWPLDVLSGSHRSKNPTIYHFQLSSILLQNTLRWSKFLYSKYKCWKSLQDLRVNRTLYKNFV